MRHVLILTVVVAALTACASTTPKQVRSEFEDIPVPRGLALDHGRTVIIESPTVKAAKLAYRGRLEPDSLGSAFRTTLEANGWKHLSSTTSSSKGTTQVYEKSGSYLQVDIWESFWSCMFDTCVSISATRVVSSASQAQHVDPAQREREPLRQ
jgi:hypothetical protein